MFKPRALRDVFSYQRGRLLLFYFVVVYQDLSQFLVIGHSLFEKSLDPAISQFICR